MATLYVYENFTIKYVSLMAKLQIDPMNLLWNIDVMILIKKYAIYRDEMGQNLKSKVPHYTYMYT